MQKGKRRLLYLLINMPCRIILKLENLLNVKDTIHFLEQTRKESKTLKLRQREYIIPKICCIRGAQCR